MAVISMKTLFEAGVHFGHKTQKWHPKMKEYIYGAKAGIYIIDLRQTMGKLKEAYEYAFNMSASGGKILFVGTKYTAQEIMANAAKKSDNYFVNLRWLGGMLTNFNTIKQSIAKLKKYEEMAGSDGSYPGVLKKEAVRAEKQRKKLEAVLGGIRDMKKMPAAMFVVDINREFIAIEEAKKLGIPIMAIVDTNCDPRGIDYVIPGNDDSAHCIELFTNVITTAVIQGRKSYENKVKSLKQQEATKKKVAPRSTREAAKPAAKPAEAKAPAAKPAEVKAPAAKPAEAKASAEKPAEVKAPAAE
ncbi:MAG: 30S ribosomal protein S2 [SAR324 cluster bacterium]|uniref:Small ribosomal subunit protein uS2 n=1 Tax=SAR324 cluster bacterium TaxID=2024889 RepID=A0A2A4SNY9_9DELT|nr:MAG: 30S ribosomal protein S2 [SAR324 cluster bacterium]